MQRISARKILQVGMEKIWRLLGNTDQSYKFTLVYDDGDVVSNDMLVKYALPAWGFHKLTPELPLLKRHGVEGYLKKGVLPAQANLAQQSRIFEDIWDYMVHPGMTDKEVTDVIEKISKTGLVACNDLYNYLVTYGKVYQVSFGLDNYYALSRDPVLTNAVANSTPDERGVASIYDAVDEVINSVRHKDNPVAIAAVAGCVRMAQVYQIIGCRGFATDVDLRLFANPVRSSYLSGLRLIGDLIASSRDNTLAQANSGEPLKKVEYFNRVAQMVELTLVNLHRTDCGSTDTLNWLIEDEFGLNLCLGKNYIDTDGGLKYIRGNEKHLIGTYVRLRSPLGKCKKSDRLGVCSTCFGQLSRNVPARTNIGRWCSVALFSDMSQKVLGTKHSIKSSKREVLVVMAGHEDYLLAHPEEKGYCLSPDLKKYAQVKIVISPAQAPNLTDVRSDMFDHKTVNIERISLFPETKRADRNKKKKPGDLRFVCTDSDGLITETRLDITHTGNDAYLSREMLNYIRLYGWGVDYAGNFEIDMGSWDYTQSVVTLPSKFRDMLHHQSVIESFLRNTQITDEEIAIEDLLKQYVKLVGGIVVTNLTLLEMTLWAFLAENKPGNDYFPIKSGQSWRKMGLDEVFQNRSASALMAFEGHRTTFTAPSGLLNDDRPDHPFDEIFVPDQFQPFEN